jgi:PleD family two-component response regulator
LLIEDDESSPRSSTISPTKNARKSIRKFFDGSDVTISEASLGQRCNLGMPEKPKILIVDDKPGNLCALARLLEKLHADIIEAQSGAEALSLVLERDFCVEIVDIQTIEFTIPQANSPVA